MKHKRRPGGSERDDNGDLSDLEAVGQPETAILRNFPKMSLS